jgi:hypothetical protein
VAVSCEKWGRCIVDLWRGEHLFLCVRRNDQYRGHFEWIIEAKIKVADAGSAEHQIRRLIAFRDTARPAQILPFYLFDPLLADLIGQCHARLVVQHNGRVYQ